MTVVVWHIGIHRYHANNVTSEVQVVPWTRPISEVADFHLARKKMRPSPNVGISTIKSYYDSLYPSFANASIVNFM